MSRSAVPSQGGLFGRTTSLPLRIIIVGAGIAGLACAYNLRQAGHSVRVLERDDRVGKGARGLRVPPNMTRLLLRWGLGPQLKKCSTRCSNILFHDAQSGDTVGEIVFHKEISEALDGDLLMAQHADLHRMLYELVVESGVLVEFNSLVTDVDTSTPSVVLADGRTLYANIVVGADGDRSVVRGALREHEPEEESLGPFSCYGTLIPVSRMGDDEGLKRLAEDGSVGVSLLDKKRGVIVAAFQWRSWMGDRCAVLTHAAQGGKSLSMNILMEEQKIPLPERWRHRVPIDQIDLSSFDPTIQRLAKLAPFAIQAQHILLPQLDRWFSDSGRTVIVGEAAHLTNPGSTHCASLGVEDAAVLGSLFSRLSSHDQIIRLLAAYQELRETRCEIVRQSEYGVAEMVTLPPGPHREGRNANMRGQRAAGMQDWETCPEKYLREQWEGFAELLGYDAYDDADTWWVEWGVMYDRMEGRKEEHSLEGLHVEVRADVVVDT